jgi:hypothetical protein
MAQADSFSFEVSSRARPIGTEDKGMFDSQDRKSGRIEKMEDCYDLPP